MPDKPAGNAAGDAEPGRRDRKKSETRQALRQAAHQLFAERGFRQTTIEDITEAADVSRRTFFRYYSSKEDLLRAEVSDLLPVMLTALRGRPAGEPPLAAIHAAVGPIELILLRLLADWEQGIADVLLERAGVVPAAASEPERLRATVRACAAASALRASAQLYRARYPGEGLETGRLQPIVDQAFAALGA